MVVGTLIGGTSDIASQLISGTSFGDINWWTIGVSTLIGGVTGAISGAGAKNKVEMNKAISRNPLVQKAQNSVAKVGDKIAKGLYATAQGAKSAYTQTMNRLSNAIFSAAASYSRISIIKALSFYSISTILTSLIP